MSRPWDAVVVGAGPNGLAAAARLARAGARVVVFERAATVGGNTRTQSFLVPGVVHDLGAAVVPFAAISPAFAALGLDLPFRSGPLALAHPLGADRAVGVAQSLEETAAGLGVDGPRYRRLLSPFVEHIDALADSTLGPVTGQARHPLLAARFGPLALLPATVLARGFRTAEARALFAGLAAHATVAPDRPLTAGVALTLLAALHAVGWPVLEGGTQTVTDRLAAVVLAAGGEIELDHEVRSLADLPPSTVTLLDVTPRQLVRLAPDAAARYGRWRYGPGAGKVDYVLSAPVPWTAEAARLSPTLHLGGTLDEIVRSERAVAAGRDSGEPFVIVVQPHLADPTRMVDGRMPLWAYCHVPNGSDTDPSAAIEATIDRYAPGWRDLVVARRTLTAAASEETNPNLVGGDLAGGLMSPVQVLLGPRPGRSPYATNLPGVYLCSSSTPPGAGVHGMAGWHAAGRALRHLGRNGR